MAESCIVCSSPSRRPVRKLLDTPSCITALCNYSFYDLCQLWNSWLLYLYSWEGN